MIRVLINNWWLLALRGVFALLFAMFAFSLQTVMGMWLLSAIALAGLVVLFGLLALSAGICTMAAAVRGAGYEKSSLLLWDGVIICIAGAAIILAPRLDLVWLVYGFAVLALVAGVIELLQARKLRRHISDEWFLALAGAGSLCLGAYLLVARPTGATTMLRWLGVYAGFSAVAILGLAFRLRALRASVHALARHSTPVTPRV
jgi:uncharacterized membrane protein HdeD (DUF308 family)